MRLPTCGAPGRSRAAWRAKRHLIECLPPVRAARARSGHRRRPSARAGARGEARCEGRGTRLLAGDAGTVTRALRRKPLRGDRGAQSRRPAARASAASTRWSRASPSTTCRTRASRRSMRRSSRCWSRAVCSATWNTSRLRPCACTRSSSPRSACHLPTRTHRTSSSTSTRSSNGCARSLRGRGLPLEVAGAGAAGRSEGDGLAAPGSQLQGRPSL